MPETLFGVTKRAIDLSVSGVVLVLLSPLLLILTLLIKISGSGPAFFSQIRAGRDGVPFTILKFRTMANGPVSIANVSAVHDWRDGVPDEFEFKSSTHANRRITWIGGFLRRWSLDELPQLLNVWRGDMSLVGPRPEILSIADHYSSEQQRRLHVKPGITGWAQVNGRSSMNHGQKIKADLYYVDQISLQLDLRILVRTIRVALSGKHTH